MIKPMNLSMNATEQGNSGLQDRMITDANDRRVRPAAPQGPVAPTTRQSPRDNPIGPSTPAGERRRSSSQS